MFSFCSSVCMYAQNQKNYWLEINITWRTGLARILPRGYSHRRRVILTFGMLKGSVSGERVKPPPCPKITFSSSFVCKCYILVHSFATKCIQQHDDKPQSEQVCFILWHWHLHHLWLRLWHGISVMMNLRSD